ncbi:MAG: oligopeptidase A, partial [Betaproteobacteria bacterium]|nr:oligopeptidase A [Betaproteobacteria bacterium]
MSNPLLDFSGLPLFDKVTPKAIAPAIDELLTQADQALKTVTQANFPAEWLAITNVLNTATERLSRAWGMVSHLQSVMDKPELRSAYNAELPRITEFWTRLGANQDLYAKYKAIDVTTLDAAQAHAHKLAMRNFVLSGAELQGKDKVRFAAIQAKQAELSQLFSEHVLDATDAWSYLATESEMAGVPEDVCQAALEAAKAEGLPGYKLSLKMPCYLPVMQYAKSIPLREKLYRAHSTRASDQSEQTQFDNSRLLQTILELRQEEAQLLGHANYAEVSLASKMAESPDQVLRFLRDLATRARPFAEKDLEEMRVYARDVLDIPNPQAWDWIYIGEKLKEARYAFSEQEVKSYFTAPKVLSGLFAIVETLFEVQIRQELAPVWHPKVQFFRIERHGELVGQFYLDPGVRQGKRGGAWMDDVRARWLRPDSDQLQTPIAQLVCNFAEGIGGQPPLLTHDDVITLFHEFGHG